jgi:hypothetical protein
MRSDAGKSKDVDALKQGFVVAARRIYYAHPSLVYLKAATQGSNLDEAVLTLRELVTCSTSM